MHRYVLGATRPCHFTIDGRPVSFERFRRTLLRLGRLRPQPELQLQPDPHASYRCVNRMLRVIKESRVTRLGFIGNEQYPSGDPPVDTSSPR